MNITVEWTNNKVCIQQSWKDTIVSNFNHIIQLAQYFRAYNNFMCDSPPNENTPRKASHQFTDLNQPCRTNSLTEFWRHLRYNNIIEQSWLISTISIVFVGYINQSTLTLIFFNLVKLVQKCMTIEREDIDFAVSPLFYQTIINSCPHPQLPMA